MKRYIRNAVDLSHMKLKTDRFHLDEFYDPSAVEDLVTSISDNVDQLCSIYPEVPYI